MRNEYKIGVVGDKFSVIGFRAAGFAVHPADGAIEAEKILSDLSKENYAVIFITEDLARSMQHVINRYRVLPIPAIITIPGKNGSSGYGTAQMKEAVIRAIGADILFKE